MKDQNPDLFSNLPTGNMMEAHVVSTVDKSKLDIVTIDLQENNRQVFLMADYPSIAKSMNENK